MTSVNKGFSTRAQLGLRAPKSVSRNITPANGGSAVHWNGGPVKIPATADHAKCITHWQADQRYHMDRQGWADIAYTGGFCQHGVCLAGRGFGVRTAANGSNVGNQNYYAFCWLGGEGESPTKDALNALEWWVNEARVHGGAGNGAKAHRSLFATACPGEILTIRASLLNNQRIYAPSPSVVQAPIKLTPKEDDMKPWFFRAATGAIVVVTPNGVRGVTSTQWKMWTKAGFKTEPSMSSLSAEEFQLAIASLGGMVK